MSPDRGKVAVVVLNWNGRDDTLECLESLMKVDYPNFEILVVDNGSSDDSVSAIRERFPEVGLLETGENLGFAGGNNAGIARALDGGAEFIFLLNNDTIVDSSVLGNLVTAAESTDAGGIFGAKIYYYFEPQKLWYAGGVWADTRSHFLHVGQNEMDNGVSYRALAETDYACGCAFFVKASVFSEVGLLDEKFFLTYEEADLCYRARKAGFRSYVVPDAKVWHKVSRSMGGAGSVIFNYFMARNRLLWAEKNLCFRKRLVLYRRVIKELARSFFLPRLGPQEMKATNRFGWLGAYCGALTMRVQDPVRRARLRGIGDYLLRRFGDCPDYIRGLGR
jgi:GT2 family glycosyltransferase